jgi:mRNA-degrading endonuclease YafQ of YafQ-DinJ toxin-antitoxin module
VLTANYTPKFLRDIKWLQKKHANLGQLQDTIDLILEDSKQTRRKLKRHYRMHRLKGEWAESYECARARPCRACQKCRLKKQSTDFDRRFCQKPLLKNKPTFSEHTFLPKYAPEKRIWQSSMPKYPFEKTSIVFQTAILAKTHSSKTLFVVQRGILAKAQCGSVRFSCIGFHVILYGVTPYKIKQGKEEYHVYSHD